MNNIKGFAIANDGNMKRIAVTYDQINDDGKVVKSNMKMNRIVTDPAIIESINKLWDYSCFITNEE